MYIYIYIQFNVYIGKSLTKGNPLYTHIITGVPYGPVKQSSILPYTQTI